MNKSKRWARDHVCCVKCGTTQRKHQARGMCVNCYVNWWRCPSRTGLPRQKRNGYQKRVQPIVSHAYVIWDHAKARAAARGLELCSYEDFKAWAIQNEVFIELRKRWFKSGYDPRLSPSIDRIDPRLGYQLSNIAFITRSANASKGRAYDRLVLRQAGGLE